MGPVGGGVCCNVLSFLQLQSLTLRRPPFRGPLRDLLAESHPGGLGLRVFGKSQEAALLLMIIAHSVQLLTQLLHVTESPVLNMDVYYYTISFQGHGRVSV